MARPWSDRTTLLGATFGDAPRTLVPWSPVGGRKGEPLFDPAEVARVLEGPQVLVPVDPGDLRATQPYVTRAGVAHYLTGVYERTGETYADRHERANRFPIVLARAERPPVVLSGHHRATAALLRGVPLWARLIPAAAEAPAHRSVTAALHVGPTSPAGPVRCVAPAVEGIAAGGTAIVADDVAATEVLERLGTSPTHIARCLHFSHTGALHP
jgi:hypothetical protein